MKIGLIDVDGHNYPNLPLMKLSAWHKAQGDTVEWYQPFDRFDKVYMSKVFSDSPDHNEYINADEVVRGGTGYAIHGAGGETYCKEDDPSLPDEVEHIYPDYSLYHSPSDTAYGFLTRGCPRGCSFCIVGKKEGLCSRKVADLSEFWHGQKTIVLNDPNILACREWEDLLGQLTESKAMVDFNQGLDARVLTESKCEALSKIRIKEIHFAWDRYEDKELVLPKLKMFAETTKKKPHSHNAIVYVLVNHTSTMEQDLERIYTLRELGYWAYVMIYDKRNADHRYIDLQRWCNNRIIFAKCQRFEDYGKVAAIENKKTDKTFLNMEDRRILENQVKMLKEMQRRKAKDRFRDYLSYINPKYKMKWFHGVIADLCQDFYEGKVDKLIITLPPQHGKSEISSRIFPSWVFGKDPDTQLVLVSYASDLAKGFCLSVQRYMGTDEYKKLFPKTFLNTDRLSKYRHYLCSSEYFDIVERRGFMKTVGVSGGLTGNPVRVAIIDDPFKDSEEANSPVQRDKVWDWYNNVLSTRLHNDSRQLMVMTRWHEDDLVGRILQSKDADKWKLVNIPAICMVEDDGEFHSGRKVGDALWPEEHSLENLYIRMNNDPHGFNCLYQGNPGSKEGRLYHEFKTWADKKEWGTYVRSGGYLDVADGGTDDTTLITYDIYRAPTGVYNEQTNRYEPLLFALITDFESNPANTDVMRVRVPMVINRQVPAVRNLWCESNSGGRTFGSDVSKKVRARVSMFHQGANKESRIITNAPFVNEQIIMPFGWESRFPGLYDKVTKYLRVFKANAHDDVPDVLTGIYEKELAVGNDAEYGKRRGVRRR